MYSLTYFLLVYSRDAERFAVVIFLCSAIIANLAAIFFWSRELEGPHQCTCSRYCSAFSLELSNRIGYAKQCAHHFLAYVRVFFVCLLCNGTLCVCVCVFVRLFVFACLRSRS